MHFDGMQMDMRMCNKLNQSSQSAKTTATAEWYASAISNKLRKPKRQKTNQ